MNLLLSSLLTRGRIEGARNKPSSFAFSHPHAIDALAEEEEDKLKGRRQRSRPYFLVFPLFPQCPRLNLVIFVSHRGRILAHPQNLDFFHGILLTVSGLGTILVLWKAAITGKAAKGVLTLTSFFSGGGARKKFCLKGGKNEFLQMLQLVNLPQKRFCK